MTTERFNKFVQPIQALLQRHLSDLSLIYIFGSQVSGDVHENSDVDVAILCANKIAPLVRWNIATELADLLNTDVDLVDLLEASTVMQHQIIFNGVCIYDLDKKRATFEMQVMSMYQHLNFERDDIIKEYMSKP